MGDLHAPYFSVTLGKPLVARARWRDDRRVGGGRLGLVGSEMNRVALKMLFHDRGKYMGLILGVAISILLINQQVGVFIGMLLRASAVVRDVPQATLWVMDPGLKNMDTVFPLRDTELGRVRGVTGVRWGAGGATLCIAPPERRVKPQYRRDLWPLENSAPARVRLVFDNGWPRLPRAPHPCLAHRTGDNFPASKTGDGTGLEIASRCAGARA